MGILNSLFGKKSSTEKKNENVLPWIPLTSLGQLDEITQNSVTKTQMIFKHSTSCGISRMVFTMFSKDFDFKKSQVDLYYLDLHGYRQVSDEVGYKFQVPHQSPQLLVVKNGVVVAHSSHGAIVDMDFNAFV